jgi:hypothetical protein
MADCHFLGKTQKKFLFALVHPFERLPTNQADLKFPIVFSSARLDTKEGCATSATNHSVSVQTEPKDLDLLKRD